VITLVVSVIVIIMAAIVTSIIIIMIAIVILAIVTSITIIMVAIITVIIIIVISAIIIIIIGKDIYLLDPYGNLKCTAASLSSPPRHAGHRRVPWRSCLG